MGKKHRKILSRRVRNIPVTDQSQCESISGITMISIWQYLDRLNSRKRETARQAFKAAGLKETWQQGFQVRKLDAIVDEFIKRTKIGSRGTTAPTMQA
jgi:hypothetical protein